MESEESENIERWHAWRAACEHGWDWAEAYDICLHPDTRVPMDRILAEPAFKAAGQVAKGA